jgi:hypothetical protein
MKNCIFIFLTIEILTFTIVLSQPTLEWGNVYPDSNIFVSSSYALTSDNFGNAYITGVAEINQISYYCTIKYSPSGLRQWVSLFQGVGAGGRIPCAIALDNHLNVYVTGYSFRYGTIFDYCTIKYDTKGTEQWVRYYDGIMHSYDQAQKIVVDSAGNIYVTGFSSINGYDARVYVTIKYNTDGDSIWTRTYGAGDIGTKVNDIKTDENCNIYVTGGCDAKAVTVKYDSAGNQKWADIYSNGGNYSLATSLALDKDKNVIITGYTEFPQNRRAYFTIKYSSSGLQQWCKAIEPGTAMNSYFQSNSVVVDEINNIFISGFSHADDSSPSQMFIQKYSSGGDSIWYRSNTEDTLSPPFTFIEIDKNNNLYTSAAKSNQNLTQILLTKYDSSGTKIWKTLTNYSNANSVPYAITLDRNNNIFITGSKDPLGPVYINMLTLKYSQVTGIINNKKNHVNNYKLYQNYPNPFNPVTTISYELSVESYVKILVYDISGKEVAILKNEKETAGKFYVEFSALNYSSGIYFYSMIINDNLIDTKKMLFTK